MSVGLNVWSQTASNNSTSDTNINWAEGMAASQVNDSARAMMASMAKWRDDNTGTLVSSGTATAFTAATSQVFPSLTALSGQTLCVRFNVTSGAAPTLNVDGLGGKLIGVDSITVVSSGALRANSIHNLTYDNNIPGFIVHHGHSITEPGRIATHASSTPPAGWVTCDGSVLSRTTFADLFANIGTTYGSSDSLTFKAPDLRVKIPLGIDPSNATGQGAITLGSTGGELVHTLSTAELPAFTPSGSISGSVLISTGVITGPGGNNVAGSAGVGINNPTSISVNGSGFSFTGNSIGGGGSHNNVQSYLAINYIIKT